MTSAVYDRLRLELTKYAEDDYREFIMRGIPSERPFIGVRIPRIREIVQGIPASEQLEILGVEPVAVEEVLARGMIVAGLTYEEMLEYFDSQIGYIDDWCACDTFCSELRKVIKKHRAEFLDAKIEPLLNDQREFAARVGVVLIKNNYVEFDYLFMMFDRVEQLAERKEYYVKMALAWLVAECFVKFPDETLGFLHKTRLPKWAFNKAISKICDSLRVMPETKDYLRTLRK